MSNPLRPSLVDRCRATNRFVDRFLSSAVRSIIVALSPSFVPAHSLRWVEIQLPQKRLENLLEFERKLKQVFKSIFSTPIQ